ncbi:MAG: redoxin family protein, partial [Bacteroides sp.]|nr:redoxin family protein [Bacteroides sp.]
LCISKDLPFAQHRFCVAEGIERVMTLSDFRNTSRFGEQYGVLIDDGLMKGLLARAVVVINPQREVVYSELVPEITQEPDYKKVLSLF